MIAGLLNSFIDLICSSLRIATRPLLRLVNSHRALPFDIRSLVHLASLAERLHPPLSFLFNFEFAHYLLFILERGKLAIMLDLRGPSPEVYMSADSERPDQDPERPITPESLTTVEEKSDDGSDSGPEEGQFDDAPTEQENASKRDSMPENTSPKLEDASKRDSKFSKLDDPVKETTDKPAPSATCMSTVEKKGSPPPRDLEQGIPDQEPQPPEKNSNSHQYPGPVALSLLTIGICLSVFLVSLDRTIITTVRKTIIWCFLPADAR